MKHIPNSITLLNLLSGAIGVVAALSGFWQIAFWLMIAAAVFDFFDGFAARLLHVSSPVGKELDSLADLISFGFLPSVMLYRMLYESINLPDVAITGFLNLIPFVSLIVLASSALRLAKFNVDTRQSVFFVGMPTPANAIFIGGVSLVNHAVCHCNSLGKFVSDYRFVLAIVVFSSIMPLINLPMLSLKFYNLSFKQNFWRYLLIFGAIVIFSIFIYVWYMSVSIIILYYVLLSLLWTLFTKPLQNNKL